MMKNMDQKEGRGTWYIFFYQAIFSSNCLEDVILQYCLLSIPQASMAEEQRDWETKENLNIEKEGYRFKRKWCGLHSYPCRIIFQSHLFISACTDRHVTYVLWTASEKILLTQPILPTYHISNSTSARREEWRTKMDGYYQHLHLIASKPTR